MQEAAVTQALLLLLLPLLSLMLPFKPLKPVAKLPPLPLIKLKQISADWCRRRSAFLSFGPSTE
jgi:hypothetical protein